MKKRARRRQRPPEAKPAAPPVPEAGPDTSAAAGWSAERWGWLVAGVLVAALLATLAHRLWNATNPEDAPAPVANGRETDDHKPKKDASENDSFLDAFNDKDAKTEPETGGVLSNAELEKQFEELAELSDQLAALKLRIAALDPGANDRDIEQAAARLVKQCNDRSTTLEKEAVRARLARPADAVPRWLSGELLSLVGGEPEEVMPHLKDAIARGLHRPRLLGSISRNQLGANQFADAYRTAALALDRYPEDRVVWDAYVRAAFGSNQFNRVIERLIRTFPAGMPEWARSIRQSAESQQTRWEAEEKRRRAEAQADDLPRVRLVIEHRRFARDAAGKPLTTIESTGREEVLLELFENEAPKTVANFIDLVSQKFYDGTSFHLAVPAAWVFGGDPNSRDDDPSNDGKGGPGYVIPDEFKAPGARSHFRGSLSMFNQGRPHSAGSQFFFNLSPMPEMNGHFTVFGRVIEGQDAVDRITRGRTFKSSPAHVGRLIPGDRLVQAKLVRTRPHEYRAVKEQP
jgi:cyclophilin family peptidyl-prolyl cis-trans isomerase